MRETTNTQIHEEHEDKCEAVVEKRKLDGANAITLMIHKHRCVTLVMCTTVHA